MGARKAGFTADHLWIVLDEGVATVGVSDFAQAALGDIVYVDLPEIGRRAEAGQEIAVVESVKTASEIAAPADGEIVAVNAALKDRPELVNENAEGDGWLFKLRPAQGSAPAGLMDRESYLATAEAGD